MMPDITLIDRLRHGASNIHSIGPIKAADLLREAVTALEMSSPPKVAAAPWPQPAHASSAPTFCHCHPGRPMANCPNPNCQ